MEISLSIAFAALCAWDAFRRWLSRGDVTDADQLRADIEATRAEVRALHSSMAAREVNAPIKPQKGPYRSIMSQRG